MQPRFLINLINLAPSAHQVWKLLQDEAGFDPEEHLLAEDERAGAEPAPELQAVSYNH